VPKNFPLRPKAQTEYIRYGQTDKQMDGRTTTHTNSSTIRPKGHSGSANLSQRYANLFSLLCLPGGSIIFGGGLPSLAMVKKSFNPI